MHALQPRFNSPRHLSGALPCEGEAGFHLRFRSLFREGRGYSFPCDGKGNVDIDSLSERAGLNYFFARGVCGNGDPVVADLAKLFELSVRTPKKCGDIVFRRDHRRSRNARLAALEFHAINPKLSGGLRDRRCRSAERPSASERKIEPHP